MSQQVLERPMIGLESDSTKSYPPLTGFDRCDGVTFQKDLKTGIPGKGSCRAQAFVRVVLPSGFDLVFCGHCAGEQTVGKDSTGTKSAVQASNRAKLEALGAKFHSDYATINLKPTDNKNSNGF